MKENTKFADQSKLYYSSTLFSHLSLKNIFQFFLYKSLKKYSALQNVLQRYTIREIWEFWQFLTFYMQLCFVKDQCAIQGQ